MRLLLFSLLFALLNMPLVAGLQNLTLDRALRILDKKNIEIKIAKYNAQMKKYEQIAAEGYDYVSSLTTLFQFINSISPKFIRRNLK